MTATTKARRRPLTWADLTPRKQMRLRTAVHEAGHAVAATVLGGRIAAAVLADGRVFGIHGKTVHRTVPEGAWPSILYAGPWAEARWLAGGRPSQRHLYAILDGTGHRDQQALCASAARTRWRRRRLGLWFRCSTAAGPRSSTSMPRSPVASCQDAREV